MDVEEMPLADFAPLDVRRLAYARPGDGAESWALLLPGRAPRVWLVNLHGHGSGGEQIFTRPDIQRIILEPALKLGFGVLSPHLGGNHWLGPAAAAELHELLAAVRARYGAQRFIFASGSMGGTASLIYAALHPEDVAAVAAFCPASDLSEYQAWLREHPGVVKDQIRQAIESAYGGEPEERELAYARHSTIRAAEAGRLTLPLLVVHGDADPLIPVAQSRRLAAALAGRLNLTYLEIPGGDHEPQLRSAGLFADWLALRGQNGR